jgi:hypothetical protein
MAIEHYKSLVDSVIALFYNQHNKSIALLLYDLSAFQYRYLSHNNYYG